MAAVACDLPFVLANLANRRAAVCEHNFLFLFDYHNSCLLFGRQSGCNDGVQFDCATKYATEFSTELLVKSYTKEIEDGKCLRHL